ncbi:FG-GAP-like repeat-containing protein [Candidatus Palauibacter sp.]|uniref:FG-GAP-like repeat-containing protein n=1 Tax=Candidatus Palauibacter sp. TaxID=3101350 RepID=UPI003B52C064
MKPDGHRPGGEVSRRYGGRFAIGLCTLALFGGCGEAGPPVPEASLAEILAARGMADAALQQDRLEDARAEYQRLVEMAPAEAAGYAGLGLTALKAADYEAAEENLLEARERAPDDPELALALATLGIETDDFGEARGLLDETLAADPGHARSLWGLAELEARAAGPDSDARADALARLAAAAPGNLAALATLADAQLARGELDAALGTMESLRQVAPDFRTRPRAAFEAAEDALLDGSASTAISQFADFRAAFEVTSPYQASLEELRQPGGPLAGVAALDFSFLVSLRVQEPEAVLSALRYTEASDLAGLAVLAPSSEADAAEAPAAAAMAIGDFDGDGDEDLLWARGGEGRALRVDLGRYVDASDEVGPIDAGDAETALWVDFDDDRRLDIWFAGSTSRAYRNEPAGGFGEIALPSVAGAGSTGAGSGGVAGAAHAVFAADLDQDGDLDVFEAHTGANRLFRNNGDLTFAELAADFGLAGPADGNTRDAAFGDLDNDRDVDVVLAEGAGGLRLLDNERAATFADRTERLSGTETGADGGVAAEEALAVAIGDVNGDGWLDIAVAGADRVRLLHGSASDAFTLAATAPLNGFVPRDLLFVDFDNDGWLDLAVAGTPPVSDAGVASGSGLRLFRNEGDGRLSPADEFLPDLPGGVRDVRSFDYNEDGDADLLVLGDDGSPRLLRNDGGNANHYFRLDLAGLGEGSRKNNRFGIGARVEVRAGDLFQVHTVTDPTTLIGLDGRLKADVVRVYWPNGVPQDLYFPGTDQDLVEQQTLKGSCPMLYVWDGDGFEFVGDMMWKSALGMPLGILGGQRSYAPAFPSQEYRRLPDGVLQPLDGEYVMQITEELWETIYVDGVNLVAVDHPSEIDVYVNEAFIPPAPIDLELWRVGERHAPVSATDENGRDHRRALAERDFDYVSSFRPGRFQGIAEPHELILDLGPEAASGDVTLFLTGWIFPTDASINVAIGQSDALQPHFPELDVMGRDGGWQPAIPGLSFPSGKDKTVVADLRGLFPTEDRRVRIRTNLMVYWDEAFFTTGPAHPAEDEARVTSVMPAASDIHHRGFAREFRKGGRYGPHWFDYNSVTVEPRWHDLFGLYTRYGDVTDLVAEGDDRYVIQNAGDEITLRFDAEAFPTLPEGWTRTFLIYSDGWVKDGDLNTATGDRVDPLPYRSLPGYPPASPVEGVDTDMDAVLGEYLTRPVTPARSGGR